MTFSADLLDAAKASQGIASDYALAALLGVPRGTVSNYRRGTNFPENSIAWSLAELAKTDPISAVIGCNLDRAKSPEDQRIWRAVGEKLAACNRAHG